MIYTNKKMMQILNTINPVVKIKQCYINIEYISYPIFVEVEECILLKDKTEEMEELNMSFIYELYGDKSGFEASFNHIHITQDTNNNIRNPIEGLKFAMHILNIWKSKLNTDFPECKFHLLLSFDGETSTLRFHRYREEEGSWIRINDLDGYKNEAILVMEI